MSDGENAWHIYSRSLVRRRNLQDTIGVNFECDLNLRHAARSGRNTGELEFAKQVIVLCQRSFTLEDLDKDSRLVIGGR